MGAALLGVALAGTGGCGMLGGGAHAETPQEQADRVSREGRMTAEVLARLAAEPAVDAGGIRPQVVRDEIHLHGTVRGFGALQCALANAELVAGVRLVVDYLVMQPGPSQVQCLAPRVFAGAARDSAGAAPGG